MSFLVGSFLSLIPFFFRHHRVFSEVRKHSVLVFFKKVPNAALYTCRSLRGGGLWRERMTEKRGLGSSAGSATSMQERAGLAQTRRVDFAAAFVLGERLSASAAPGNGAPRTSHLETDAWLLEAHLCGARVQPCKPVRVALSAKWPESCFPSSSAEGGGGGGLKHQFSPAWWHQSV